MSRPAVAVSVQDAAQMVMDAYQAITNSDGNPELNTGFTAPPGWMLTKIIDHTSTAR